jgi:hypothetical protein
MRKAALIALITLAAPLLHAKEVLPFIENDYATAVARARTMRLPLFVDAWAPW